MKCFEAGGRGRLLFPLGLIHLLRLDDVRDDGLNGHAFHTRDVGVGAQEQPLLTREPGPRNVSGIFRSTCAHNTLMASTEQ